MTTLRQTIQAVKSCSQRQWHDDELGVFFCFLLVYRQFALIPVVVPLAMPPHFRRLVEELMKE